MGSLDYVDRVCRKCGVVIGPWSYYCRDCYRSLPGKTYEEKMKPLLRPNVAMITYPKYTRRRNFGLGTWWYTLQEDWTIDIHNIKKPPKHYTNNEISIDLIDKGIIFSAVKGVQWDGATGAPDFETVIPGTLVHDMLYKHLRPISAHWGWRERKTRLWADAAFNEVNKIFGFYRYLKRLYFRAVVALGGLWRWLGYTLKRMIIVSALVSTGCVSTYHRAQERDDARMVASVSIDVFSVLKARKTLEEPFITWGYARNLLIETIGWGLVYYGGDQLMQNTENNYHGDYYNQSIRQESCK